MNPREAEIIRRQEARRAELEGLAAAAAVVQRRVRVEANPQPPPTSDGCDPVGASEIATRLGVKAQTIGQWRQRGLFPAPDFIVGGRPAWQWVRVAEWAARTGRLPKGE